MNKSRLDWSLLPSLLAILDHQTLARAAKSLGLSQPTLGRHVLELEQQLGVVLFERTGRGLFPTPQAIQLAELVRDMDVNASNLLRIAKSKNLEPKGRVRISASQPVACILLPDIFARLQLTMPEIDIDLVSSNSLSNLLRREADIALRMVRPVQDSLITKKIAQVQLVTCAHSTYIKRNGRPLEASDLFAHKLIGSESGTEIQAHARKIGIDPGKFNYSFRSDDLIAQWSAIRAGLGVGFVPEYVAATEKEIELLLPEEY
jgi:DNA-binding transcriptional LysR family regulator